MPNLYRVRYEFAGATGCYCAVDRRDALREAARLDFHFRGMADVWIEPPEWEAVYRGAKHLEDDPCPLATGGVEFE